MRNRLEIKAKRILAKSPIMNLIRPCAESTLITGCVRGGTTLAMRVICDGMKREEEQANVAFNEPQPFSGLILSREYQYLDGALSLALRNRYHIVKSPHAAWILPMLKLPLGRVIVTFRDLRAIVASMVRHRQANRDIITPGAFWEDFSTETIPLNHFDRSLLAAKTAYLQILEADRALEIWNFGDWGQWEVRNRDTQSLYSRAGETSHAVMSDLTGGSLFSMKNYGVEQWDIFCDEYGVTAEQKENVSIANDELKVAYLGQNYKLKFFEDTVLSSSGV